MDESLSTYLPRLAADSDSVLRCGDIQQKHESSIFNSVSLGQWETARASFQCLAVSQEVGARENARELLKILILEAAKFWLAPILTYLQLWGPRLVHLHGNWFLYLRTSICLSVPPSPKVGGSVAYISTSLGAISPAVWPAETNMWAQEYQTKNYL